MNLELSGAGGPVHATGRVIWSDLTGRTGVQLRKASLSAPRRLDEYLFLNAITACSHYEALQAGAAASELRDQLLAEDLAQSPSNELTDGGFPDYPALLACLTEIKTDMDAPGLTLGASLQTLAGRALTFLHASGVAVAISSGTEMICRACAGSAPDLGTRFQSGVGFSGECIRSGTLMLCDDAENDPRVDQGACLTLGIRSILAAPIRSASRVVGLIEVFSANPRAFSRNSRVFLQRLTEMVAAQTGEGSAEADPMLADVAEGQKAQSQGMSFDEPQPGEWDPTVLPSTLPPPDEFFSSRLQRILVLGTAAALLVVATLVTPWMRTKAGNTHPAGPGFQPPSFHQTSLRTSASGAPASELQSLRQLAEAGDGNAQFSLGARYATGDEVTQDYVTAARWFSLAADQGHVVAQATLGAYYWAGRGVPADLHKAYFWSVLAQAGGDEGSRFRLASLASRMSHSEVVRVQEEANEWIKQHQLASRAAADPRP